METKLIIELSDNGRTHSKQVFNIDLHCFTLDLLDIDLHCFTLGRIEGLVRVRRVRIPGGELEALY
jgi:hypothetical protein